MALREKPQLVRENSQVSVSVVDKRSPILTQQRRIGGRSRRDNIHNRRY